jgi:methionyl-tRNA formyltransferase
MLAKTRVNIGPHETSAVLESRLATIGARLLLDTVDRLSAGPVVEEPQPDDEVTYAHRLERSESRVNWHRPAADIHNQIRGLQPWPVATVLFRGRRLRLLGSVPEDTESTFTPGTVVTVDADGFVVQCHPGAVRILRVQLEGRAPTAAADFLHGHHVSIGDSLDQLPAAI